ncbi:MAG: PLDc N-terminal domain-containing protein [Luteibaculaceae bacterium]
MESDAILALGGLFILGAILFIWALPILIILFSGRTSFSEKLAWILAVLFISWFAFIFYLLLAPLKRK